MPIYEYICEDCKLEFDALRSMKEADKPISCTKCHSLNTKRKVSGFFAVSGGKSIAGGSGCGGCSGGSCSSCNH